MFYTDDPIADAERHIAHQEEELESLPRCSECDNPIQTEQCYVINDEPICEHCMEGHKKYTEDLMG